jgi:AcrR family transcriptional regulator
MQEEQRGEGRGVWGEGLKIPSDAHPTKREPNADAPPRRPTVGAPTTDLRSAILDAARHLLVVAGYREVSMRDVARRVGCSVSSIYLYFANKDALIHALIDEGFGRWYEAQLLAESGASTAREKLERTCRAYIQFGVENPEYYEIMFMFHPGRMGRYPKELYRRARRSMDHLAGVLAEYAPSLGSASGEEAHVAAAAVWSTLHGVTSTLLTGRLDARIDRGKYVEAAVEYMMNGVVAEPR